MPVQVLTQKSVNRDLSFRVPIQSLGLLINHPTTRQCAVRATFNAYKYSVLRTKQVAVCLVVEKYTHTNPQITGYGLLFALASVHRVT
jgi:hypothetical protein